MTKTNVKINIIGKIIEGDTKDWYVLVQEDFTNTGGYLILISKDSSFGSGEGLDYWVEAYDNLIEFFNESKWQIEWIN